MKKLATLFLFVGLMISAQNNRVIYEYKYASDSTKIDSLKTEWMYLDINKKGSKYYSKSAFESDSIINESIKKQMASGMKSISVSRNRQGGEVSYEVEKTYPDYKISLITNIGNDTYKVSEDRPINWKISTDKKKIGEFQTQKATTHFAGRNWIAWFTTDVPIQDGPYKFSGLPGLVVKLEDDTHSHLYNLIAIKNLGVIEPEIYAFQISKEIPLKSAEYKKLLLEHRKDPAKGLRQISMDNGVVLNMANSAENDKFLKEREERLKAQIKKDNNLIEIDLLK